MLINLSILAVTVALHAAWQPVTATNAAQPQAAIAEQFTAPDELSLRASLRERVLVVQVGDSVVASFGVAIGKPGHSTPTGEFTIRKLIWNPRWVPPDSPWARGKSPRQPGDPSNPMQGVKIFFREPTYYIHGTNDEASIGKAASHGCIRMTPEEAAVVARWIMEHGGEPRPESWFQRIRRAFTSEFVVELSSPITLVIQE